MFPTLSLLAKMKRRMKVKRDQAERRQRTAAVPNEIYETVSGPNSTRGTTSELDVEYSSTAALSDGTKLVAQSPASRGSTGSKMIPGELHVLSHNSPRHDDTVARYTVVNNLVQEIIENTVSLTASLDLDIEEIAEASPRGDSTPKATSRSISIVIPQPTREENVSVSTSPSTRRLSLEIPESPVIRPAAQVAGVRRQKTQFTFKDQAVSPFRETVTSNVPTVETRQLLAPRVKQLEDLMEEITHTNDKLAQELHHLSEQYTTLSGRLDSVEFECFQRDQPARRTRNYSDSFQSIAEHEKEVFWPTTTTENLQTLRPTRQKSKSQQRQRSISIDVVSSRKRAFRAPKLYTQVRSSERRKFNRKVRERLAKRQLEEEKRQQIHESLDQEFTKIRRNIVVKANPVRQYPPIDIHRPGRKLRIPRVPIYDRSLQMVQNREDFIRREKERKYEELEAMKLHNKKKCLDL